MKAVVFHGIGDIRIDTVPDPEVTDATDAVVRLTASAICGTDLHMVRGTLGGMKPGTILGHEGVGIVETVGRDVRNLRRGDRVLIPSTIACGSCAYCRAGYPRNATSRTRAARVRVPRFRRSGRERRVQRAAGRVRAHAACACEPDSAAGCDRRRSRDPDVGHFPHRLFRRAARGSARGDTVAVFGAGPVGQFAIASAKLMGAGRVIAIDRVASRLEMACAQGAEIVDFAEDDPVETVLRLTAESASIA